MTPSRYQQLVPLFDEAMKRSAEEREAFARGLCADDPPLLKDLLELLRNADSRPDELDRPVVRLADAAPPPAAEPEKKPTGRAALKFERFRIIRQLGKGGMGRVYEAIDKQNGARVALKLIQSSRTFAADARLRFLFEARGMAALRHPNIVEIYDIEQVQGHLYLVMEYLQGRSLWDFLRKGQPTALPLTLHVMRQIAEALAFAHTQGVAHGDVKPENIMVLDSGMAKLIDFGLAADFTRVQSILGHGLGTPIYAAPERFGASPPPPNAASDLWSLGVTLYQCLSGKVPFVSAAQIATATPEPLPASLPCAEEWDALIGQLLTKDPALRTQSAPDLVSELRRLERKIPQQRASEATGERLGAAPGAAGADEAKRHPWLPDLGYRADLHGIVQVTRGYFHWRQEQKESKSLEGGGFISANSVRMAVFALVWLVFSFLIKIGGRSNILVWLAIIGVLIFSVAVLFHYLTKAVYPFFVALELGQPCRSCGLRMKLLCTRTRFLYGKVEVTYSQRDCLAALKHGLWQEAAKMMTIHGREAASERSDHLLAPTRFRLDFFECDLCLDQAARLTAEEWDGDEMTLHPEFVEAYRINLARPPRFPGYLWQLGRHAARTVASLKQTRVSARAWMVTATIVASVVGVWVLAGR